jgi:hypothetical protein
MMPPQAGPLAIWSQSPELRRISLGEYLQIKHGYAVKGEFFAESGPHIVLTPETCTLPGDALAGAMV